MSTPTTVQECCNFFWDLLDGKYGWTAEVLTLTFLVVFMNFFVKALFKSLHTKFEKENRYIQDSFVRALYKPLSYYVWFIAIINSLDLLDEKFAGHDLFLKVQEHQFILIGGILSLTWFLLRWKAYVITHLFRRSANHEIAIDHGKIDILGKGGTILVIFICILLLLEITDRNITTLVAFGGVGGLAIAFASQEIIANIFGSIMIYLTRPFTVGDWINLPERNLEGYVEEIGWYMTRIRTFEKKPIYVPNSTFSRIVVMTPSRMSHRQFKETISLRTGDFQVLKDILSDIKDLVATHPEVDHTQRMMVFFKGFTPNSIDILVDVYILRTDTVGNNEVREDLFFKIADIVHGYGADFAGSST
jgi:MscS family membrane protein